MSVTVPYLPYEQLRVKADEFLSRHHTGGYLPVPIERIIEFDFNLDIVPMPGLKDEFDVGAFITADLTEIRVDRFIMQNRPNRYRFSLAHELAHLLIHRDILTALKFSGIAGWKAAMASIPEQQYAWIESQAYNLAGLILVPRQPLADMFEERIEEAKRAGIDLLDMDVKLRKTVESNIGRHFEVSAEVISRRMEKEKMWA